MADADEEVEELAAADVGELSAPLLEDVGDVLLMEKDGKKMV